MGGGLIAVAVVIAVVALYVAGRRAKLMAQANLAVARSILHTDMAQLLASVKTGGTGTLLLAAAALLAGIDAGRRKP